MARFVPYRRRPATAPKIARRVRARMARVAKSSVGRGVRRAA